MTKSTPLIATVVALVFVAAAVLLFAGTACTETDADVASRNLSKAAEQFEVPRQIVFINGITGDYLYEVDGYCSIDPAGAGLRALAVVCKVGEKGGQPLIRKIFLGLSDNVTWLVMQGDPTRVSSTRYRVIFKPEAIVPNFDRP